MRLIERTNTILRLRKKVNEIGARKTERTLLLLKPGGMNVFNEVRNMVQRTVMANDFKVIREGPVELTEAQGFELYRQHEGQWYHSALAKQVSSCWLYAMVVEGENAVAVIKRLAGPTKPEEAKIEAPGSIRGQFVIGSYAESKARGEVVDNICHASGNVDEAEWEINIVSPGP